MPPRRAANPRRLTLMPAAVFESRAERVRRLRPDLVHDDDDNSEGGMVAAAVTPSSLRSTPAGVSAVPAASGSPHASRLIFQKTVPYARSDRPVIRNLMRGSVTGAIGSFRRMGAEVTEAELRQDRVARSSTDIAPTLLGAWRTFRAEALGETIPWLPITPAILVAIGSLFRTGGYRSFPNHITAVRDAHIEANRYWDQLLEHTMTWVSRSVLRGIGPALQSCSFAFI